MLKSRNVVAATALVILGACSIGRMAEKSLNVYGTETDEATRGRVDRLMKYCGKLSASGNLNVANGLCLRAHYLDPTNPLPLMLLADNFQKSGKDDVAVQSYQQILVNHPGNTGVSYRLGKLQAALGREEEAMGTLLAALAHAPNEPRLLNVVGILKDQKGEHSAAQFYYRESLALEPGNISVESNLGLSLALSGQAQEAVALLQGVVADPGANKISHRNLELAYKVAAENPVADTADKDPIGESESSEAPQMPSPLAALTSYISSNMPGRCDVLVDSVQVAAASLVPSVSPGGTASDAVDCYEGFNRTAPWGDLDTSSPARLASFLRELRVVIEVSDFAVRLAALEEKNALGFR